MSIFPFLVRPFLPHVLSVFSFYSFLLLLVQHKVHLLHSPLFFVCLSFSLIHAINMHCSNLANLVQYFWSCLFFFMHFVIMSYFLGFLHFSSAVLKITGMHKYAIFVYDLILFSSIWKLIAHTKHWYSSSFVLFLSPYLCPFHLSFPSFVLLAFFSCHSLSTLSFSLSLSFFLFSVLPFPPSICSTGFFLQVTVCLVCLLMHVHGVFVLCGHQKLKSDFEMRELNCEKIYGKDIRV